MEVLIILVIILWIYSSYLYHTSKFKDAYSPSTFEGSEEEQELIELIHRLYGKPIFSHRQDRTPDFTASLKPSGQFMSAEVKRNYLLSPEWQELRTQVFTRDNHTCQSCSSPKALNCHHVTYINLNNENLEDLITLCKSCHQYQHDIYGYDRVTTYFPIVSRPSTSVLNNSVLPEDSK